MYEVVMSNSCKGDQIMNALNMTILVLLVLLAGLTLPASAAVIYVDIDATGSDNGTSWTHAYNDLQDGLSDANSADEIWVAEGTYKPTDGNDRTVSFELVSGVGVYGGFDATETSRDDRDWVNNVTTLSGDIDDNAVLDSNNSYHVVASNNCDANTILDGYTITMGYADGPWAQYHDHGGGIRNRNSSSPTVDNCTFTDNYGQWGGCVYDRDSSPIVSNCTFVQNYALYGAGIYDFNSSSTLTNCTFTANSANSGGGMVNATHSAVTIRGCSFTGNSAQLAGGLLNDDSSVTVTNCIFTENSASSPGGAVVNHTLLGGDTVTLTNCLFVANDANEGGGVFNYNQSSGTFTIELTNCTFTQNDANEGGAIYNWSADPTITNCIFWDNNAPNDLTNGAEIYNYDDAADPNFSYCDIEGGINGTKCGGYDSIDGGNNINCDPCFVDSDDPNGDDNVLGTCDDGLSLSYSTCCLDAGSNSAISESTALCGADRIMDGDADCNDIVDIGAYEAYGPDCWNCDNQCYGDADCDDDVDLGDLAALKAAFGTDYGDPNYNACADFDRDGDINLGELATLKQYFGDPNLPSDCNCGGTWPPQ
jgi:parallel beta-helix repeat protein